MAVILVVDDEKNIRTGLYRALKPSGHKIILGEDGEQAHRLFMAEKIDLGIFDIRMPGMSGLEILKKINETENPIPVIFITGHANIEIAVEAMRLGAYDFMIKPINLDKLELIINRALDQRQLEDQNKSLLVQVKSFQAENQLLGRSRPIKQMIEKIKLVAPSKANVYIYGESGTGKELVCEALHSLSMEGKPLIKVHCAALSPSLLESELFGHEKGAFTGATHTKIGRFEAANGGTIFLDEISEISKDIQVKLLRVLQERSIERVGGTKTIPVDMRIISASNTELKEAVENGTFRMDLFYRLNVVDIHIPPLRERKGDIDFLAKHFFDHYSQVNGKEELKITSGVFTAFQTYPWPGNIRELKNVIEKIVVLSKDGHISISDLPPHIRNDSSQGDHVEIPLGMKMEDIERKVILATVNYCKGNKTQAAQMLDIGRKTLSRKINENFDEKKSTV